MYSLSIRSVVWHFYDNTVKCKVNIIINIMFFLVITKEFHILMTLFSKSIISLWRQFSRMDILWLLHWWVKVMYFIYWRKLILKASFCCLQQRFIHRKMLLTLGLSKSFGNILKLQSILTNIKTLDCLKLHQFFLEDMASHSSATSLTFSLIFVMNQTNCMLFKGLWWSCELFQI